MGQLVPFFSILLFCALCLAVSQLAKSRRHASRATAWGCRKPYRKHNMFPFGIDQLAALLKADQENRVPQKLLQISLDTGHATFVQSVGGFEAIVTSDPKNVQAVLALQFKDFELGSLRRKNFFPMLGNGIFTADGQSWWVVLNCSSLTVTIMR